MVLIAPELIGGAEVLDNSIFVEKVHGVIEALRCG